MPLSLSFINSGLKVIGFNIDNLKIEQIKKKKSYIWSISSKDILFPSLQLKFEYYQSV